MRKPHHQLLATGFAVTTLSLACLNIGFAATPVNLAHRPLVMLQTLSPDTTITLRTNTDFNQTQHIRVQQSYEGYPVWGADAVVHVPAHTSAKDLHSLMQSPAQQAVTMNGIMYQGLAGDLPKNSNALFEQAAMDSVLQHAITLYQKQATNPAEISHAATKPLVYVDQNHKAHWAVLTSFVAKTGKAMPEKPTYIIDAIASTVYEQWNNIQTAEETLGGGFGGNPKSGKVAYDGLDGNFTALTIQRNGTTKMCALANSDVTVKRDKDESPGPIMQFACKGKSAAHNQIYWNGSQDKTNQGFSPSNDALYIGKVVKEMYQKWYGIPVLKQNGKPMMLNMIVHADMENAYWDGSDMYFGDGGSTFFPLVSLGVGAHEVSHGFTEQHSELVYKGQPGGLNESFSDMAAQAAEFYSVGKSSWQIGAEIMKRDGEALRYMDEPTKDCGGRKPGSWCSINNVKDYTDSMDVHFTSGVFNKAFYLLATAKDWDTKKAFDVMEQANANYWTATSSFADAACGVIKAATDYKYDLAPVKAAFSGVGIDTANC